MLKINAIALTIAASSATSIILPDTPPHGGLATDSHAALATLQ